MKMIQIEKRNAAKVYSSLYDNRFKTVAQKAFYDGIVFWEMVKSGAVEADMLNEDFFSVLIESNN